MESDETRILNAAHLMVASLAGSLAHVTCKVMPLNMISFLLLIILWLYAFRLLLFYFLLPNASRFVGAITGINLRSTEDFTSEPKYCQ